MADIKTTLRELSVALTLGLLIKNEKFSQNDLYDLNKFLLYANKVTTIDEKTEILIKTTVFTNGLGRIIDNGYALGTAVYENSHFSFSPNDEVHWLGGNTQKDDPIDVTAGEYAFSLKEESFILENMGLYKLINLYTGSHFKSSEKSLFFDYAPTEYEQWFETTLKEAVKHLRSCGGVWRYENTQKGKLSFLTLTGDAVTAEYRLTGKAPVKNSFPIDCNVYEYVKRTCTKTREEVFAKFINKELSANTEYNDAKRKCAVAAAERLANDLNANLNYKEGLPRFLRIHNFEYYYAKTTSAGVRIYRVPPVSEFENNIEIESITASVPDSQANILTTIVNRKTGQRLTLRNECRFSHGQFNGTPEAKLYYEHGGSLLAIYECLD